MQRYEQRDYYSAPPGPYAEVSPPTVMPMSPPVHVRPPFYGAPDHAPHQPHGHEHGRRRASTSAAAMASGRRGGFPALQLSQSHAEQLRAIETKLLAQYLERYDSYTEANQRTVDTGLWKLVRQANGVKAYKRRGASTGTSASRRSSHASLRHGLRSRAASMAVPPGDSDEPMLLVVGSIDGMLEDVLYGAGWHSRDERSTRTYYTKDGIADASVLATLERPSSMHPFRSLAVKWSLKRSMRSATMIKDRDFVFLGATGTIRSRGDERIGYELRHSLTLPSCPPLADGSIVRAEIMSCSLFRQMRGGRVEVFHQASFDAGGDLLSMLAWNHAIDNYIGFASIIECSYIKKLVRAVQWSSENPPAKTETEDDPLAQPWDPEEKRCGVCGHPGKSLQRKCAICHVWVCSNCSARKEIFTPLPGRPSVARCFCKTCLHKVQRQDPTKYVLRELEQFEHRTATEYAHSHSLEIAVLEPRNGEMMPPPPPPLPSEEPSDSVFFALDGSPPPPPPSEIATPQPPPPPSVGRRRQGSMPMPSTIHRSERIAQRKRFVSESYDENIAPNDYDFDAAYRQGDHHQYQYERDLAAVGRSHRVSAAASARATHARKHPSGDILLRSDSGHRKWRDDEREQQQMHQQAQRQHQEEAYFLRSDEPLPLRKTTVVAAAREHGSHRHRRRTVLGSEVMAYPPHPELPSHRYDHPTTVSMLPVNFTMERRGSVPEAIERRRSLTSRDLGIQPARSSEASETGSEIPLPPPPPPSKPLRRALVTHASGKKEPIIHSRAGDIYSRLRADRPAPSSETNGGTNQRFYAQYEELIPRSATVLGEEPLVERRTPTLLPSPEPQALTSRRAQQQENHAQSHSPLQQPQQPTPSGRPSARALAPHRPNEQPQVRLSLLEKHQHEQLQREYHVLKQQQQWMNHEHDQYLLDQHAKHDRKQRRKHAPPPPPSNQDTHDESPEQDEPVREPTAREKDELAVNSLLAELCEIARMTNDYAQSASSSMVAAAATSSVQDRPLNHLAQS